MSYSLLEKVLFLTIHFRISKNRFILAENLIYGWKFIRKTFQSYDLW